MTSTHEKVLEQLATNTITKEAAVTSMKKRKDSSFRENNTKESTQIHSNNNNMPIQLKDLFQIEIITNTLDLRVKDRAAGRHLWV